ncbi:MAG TPA: hypothetical protein VN512_05280 [Clostridia bacterium]|nr:hypothetical protein [Clostridia bacterium]
MREKPDKQAVQKLSAGIFTGAMVLLCAALYFFTGKTSPESAAAAKETALPSSAPKLAQTDDFVGGKSYYTLSEEADGSQIYLLSGEDAEGTLTLALSEYGVKEFVLSAELLEAPETLKENASTLDALYYEKLTAEAEAQKVWIVKEAAELLMALDENGSVTPAGSEAFLFALNSTISDGKSRSLSCDTIEVDIFHYKDDGNLLVVTASVSEQ